MKRKLEIIVYQGKTYQREAMYWENSSRASYGFFNLTKNLLFSCVLTHYNFS